MNWVAIISCGYGAVTTVTTVVAYRGLRKREKDAAMTQLQKDITEIKTIQAEISTEIRHLVTKEEFVALADKVDRLLKRNDA